jgi:membrane protein implicated in regulation of membrane protease activity
MAQSTWWWVTAGIAVAVELGTGTFYLLMVAIGLAAGAVAAHSGADGAWQLVAAAVVGGGAVAALHFQRGKEPRQLASQANPDVNADIGETVTVDAWQADGTASVQYRGARWTAIAAHGSPRTTGTHRILEVTGNRLVVGKVEQEQP